jgi:alkanesulfonate monooxygenase SsuD/methylene tetrahydromethanopterin reductase-like flavin-dependent oxidoreductase (luciferase family)
MQFGLFGGGQAKRGGPDVDSGIGYRQFIEQCVEAEALGYRSVFTVEHHFTGLGQVSATINLMTWVAARTTTLRVGTAVIVLPWHNPVLLAEQVATLDLLSGGRFDFGIGKGYRWNEFKGFAIPMEEAEARFEECLAVMVKVWTSDAPFSHKGKYWRFEDIVVEPPCAQKPHPPLWMGAGSPESIRQVARRGHNLLLDQFAPIDEIGRRIAVFKAAVEAEGRVFDPLSVGVTRSVNILGSAAEKKEAHLRRVTARQRSEALAQTPQGDNAASIMSYAATVETSEESALYGTLDEVADKVEQLRRLGVEYLLINSPAGPAGLRRFAREVAPLFADAPAAAAAAE